MTEQPTLHITRGLPGSGKTRWAREYVDSQPPGSVIRLNREDLRRMALPIGYSVPQLDAEVVISALRDSALAGLLRRKVDVICDDTNLPTAYVKVLMEIARLAGAAVVIQDFTHVPLDICIERDRYRLSNNDTRGAYVGEDVIRGMHDRFIASHKGKPLPVPSLPEVPKTAPYVAPEGKPYAFLVDLDGTTALMNGRSPYDESCVIDDLPNMPVIETVRALTASGWQPVFMSGRTAACRDDTETWLLRHVFGTEMMTSTLPSPLLMRGVGDTRRDAVVKLELFNHYVRDQYHVRLILDDRSSVVEMWRGLGLTCLQVAPGNF
jgi:predicted kinase